MVFVVESPVRSDGGIEHEGHQYLCSSHLAETKLVDGDLSGALPQCFYVRDRSVDLGLPQMNGFELAQRLRELPQTRQSLLVALTGYGQSEDRRKTEEAGFDHHLVKPVDPARLSQLVETAPVVD